MGEVIGSRLCLQDDIVSQAFQVYDSLIARNEYEAAVDFAEHHGLDKDKVLKSQWISSDKSVQHVINVLSNIKDIDFILSECMTVVGPTEEATRSLLSLGLQLTDSYKISELEDDENDQIWNFRVTRLKLLQFGDRLETFLGTNMGRFSAGEYSRFRSLPISKAALSLAECGKIGALNLLFKRHPYSLLLSMFEVLDAIPETVSVQSYGHLLPAASGPPTVVLRDEDWVECEMMVNYLRKLHGDHERNTQYMTEQIIMKVVPLQWPSISELSSWYKKRAVNIDSLSGQLDNCMALVDMAICKGLTGLKQFLVDISYLHDFIYSGEYDDMKNFSIGLSSWNQLSDYEKFKLIMTGVGKDEVIAQLYKMAVPFMQQKFQAANRNDDANHLIGDVLDGSFLVRWLKETALQNKLDMCVTIIDQGCRDLANGIIFKDAMELFECSLRCVYLCSDINQWNVMATILSRLLETQYVEAEDIIDKVKIAEGHVEAGRLMAYYQVPKPISFFLDAHKDEKGVKQIFRLLISKFIRWQPSRSDHDWANMWRDLQTLQEKAFSFLDSEYMLIEFCRGLLKSGRFPMARNYLKGANSVALATDKAESLVIQAAREYFFSASTLASPEIWKARECLNLLQSNRNVRAEADIIDALTVRLPNLGVNLLPMEFRQIKDRMEIIKLAITSQGGAYLNVDELIEIARLLGLSSQDEISRVQEAIAREAAFAGDTQLAFDLCLILAQQGHGLVWDLCAALARSKAVDSGNSKSRKFLLGFALSHCDVESIGELLNEWRDLDIQESCETLISFTGEESLESIEHNILDAEELPGTIDSSLGEPDLKKTAKELLSLVSQGSSCQAEFDELECLLKENGKLRYFVLSTLPWLLKLSEREEFGKRLTSQSASVVYPFSIRTRALVTILSWLSRNSFTPTDDLIASLAVSILDLPFSDGEDIHACATLLNLLGEFRGAEIIERKLSVVENSHEFSSLMNVGMIYGLLHSYSSGSQSPALKRDLLINFFRRNQKALNSGEFIEAHEAQSSFWKEWKIKLEQQKDLADRSRELQELIPGVETTRFLSGDADYIQTVIFSFLESVKVEKKKILSAALMLAKSYGLDHRKVLLYYLRTILVSEAWTVDDIVEEVSVFEEDILCCAVEVVESLSSVYPLIDGHDKERLAFIYGVLSECYGRLAYPEESPVSTGQRLFQTSNAQVSRFCKIVGEECRKVSFIERLDFKNIASLKDLNFGCLKTEVFSQVNENNVEALAKMVQNLAFIYGDKVPEDLLTCKSVYVHYLVCLLVTLEDKAEKSILLQRPGDIYSFLDETELVSGLYVKHMSIIGCPDSLHIGQRFFHIILPINKSLKNMTPDSISKDCLMKLISIWLRLISHSEALILQNIINERFYPGCLFKCLTIFVDYLAKDIVSPRQAWCTLVNFVDFGLKSDDAVEAFEFCQSMIIGGCIFQAVGHVFTEVAAYICVTVDIHCVSDLYLKVMESILHDIASESRDPSSLLFLLSSLSRLEGDLEDLKRARIAVWDRMSSFSDDMQLPSHLRVHALELMQIISGRRKELEGFSSDILASDLHWEGWGNFKESTVNLDNPSDEAPERDVSNRFVALKSSQLVKSISPALEITPEDLLSVDSAVSCFRKLAEMSTSDLHVGALLDVLAEWESIFVTEKDQKDSAVLSDTVNTLSNDDWDEGWESFQEESTQKDDNKDAGQTEPSVHPLHLCFLIIMEKLLTLSNHEWMMKLLDQSSAKSCDTILSEDDAGCLLQAVLDQDSFLALKLALLLPYRTTPLQCLDAVEKKLNAGGISDNISEDMILFLLILSSGILPTVLSEASYGNTFSYLTFMAGNLLRRFKEKQSAALSQSKSHKVDLLFASLVFPCFVAELVNGDQHILAGFMVSKFMHTSPSLSLLSTGDANLRKYLSKQLSEEYRGTAEWLEPLRNTVAGLAGKLEGLIHSALSLLPTQGFR